MKLINHSKKILIIIVLGLITGGSARSQVKDLKLDAIYNGVLSIYFSVYDAIAEGKGNDIDPDNYKNIFVKENVRIENDFFREPGNRLVFADPLDYLDKITAMFGANSTASLKLMKSPGSLDELFFCKIGDVYEVWAYKQIRYMLDGRENDYDGWVRITVKEFPGKIFRISEVKLDVKPRDADGDHIIDGYDNCPRTSRRVTAVNIKGCDNNDSDEDGVIDEEDDCPTVKGKKKTKGCPDKDNDKVRDSDDYCSEVKGAKSNKGCPISGFVIGFAGGANLPFGKEYNSKQALDNETYTWTNKSGFAKWGWMADISLQYNFSTWLGFEAGAMGIINDFDTDALEANIETFLGRNAITYNNVAVTAEAYQFIIPYFKLSLGNFNGHHSRIKLQPMGGYAFKGLIENSALIRINYSGSNTQSELVTFKSDPFLLYGGALKYEYWFPNSRISFALSAFYLRGEPEFREQQFSFSGHPSQLQFSKQMMQIGGATVGFQVNIGNSKQHYRKM